MTKKMKSTNWYTKLEDKWVMSYYNAIDDNQHCLFEPNSSMGKGSLSEIRGCIRTMIVSFVLFIWLCISLNPVVVLPLWSFLFAGILKGQVEAKMTSGYPYLEHTNAIGMMMLFFVSVPIVLVLFFVMRFLFSLING
jgi:hypothetical protein